MLTLLLLIELAGCSTVGTPTLANRIHALPAQARYRIHVHFINSPLDLPQVGRLAEVADYFRSAGIEHTTFHYLSSGSALADLVRATYRGQPDARVVLIGWSGASLWIWDALTELQHCGHRPALIIYLDSDWIKQRTARLGHPDNFDQALLIYRRLNPPVSGVPNSRVRRAATANHLSVAAHPDTVQAIGEALIELIEQ